MKVWLLHKGSIVGTCDIDRDNRQEALRAADRCFPHRYAVAKMSESPALRVPGEGFYIYMEKLAEPEYHTEVKGFDTEAT